MCNCFLKHTNKTKNEKSLFSNASKLSLFSFLFSLKILLSVNNVFHYNIRIWNNQILSLNVYLCWFASLEVRTIFPHCYKSDLLILYLWQHRTFQECNTVVIIYLALKDIFNPLFVFSTKCREKKPDLLPLYNNLTVNNEKSLILLLSIMVTFKYKKKTHHIS